MGDSTYKVKPRFPNGLNLDLLIQEMPTVWPKDLFPAQYSVDARKSGPKGLTRGTLTIETPRDITADERAAAITHFSTHAGGTAEVGTRIQDLRPPGKGPLGRMVYVVDAPWGDGGAVGCHLYDDGTSWRRTSDHGKVL